MRTNSVSWVAFGSAVVVGFGLACVVDLPPDGKYTCASDADCGGEGYVCAPAAAGPRYCCKPTGAETCDGRDNDCNGVADDITPAGCYSGLPGTQNVGPCRTGAHACSDGGVICSGQIVPVVESCNQLDDDCDGTVDDGFDLRNDPNNCGRCGVGCFNPLRCEDGGCAFPVETACGDGVDNDGDLAADCADFDCNGQSCGTGCTCRNYQKTETICSDTQDNDQDIAIDCADSDCDGGSCATGCQCSGGNKLETLCNDTQDNDQDTATDCADSDCNGQSCGTGCACRGGQKAEIVCLDTQDNDGDSFTDCADSDCDGGSCGSGCLCQGGWKSELVCSDNQDNDGDTAIDCTDSDCDGGSCGNGCQCAGGRKTEINCIQQPTPSPDEDGDGLANCADPDCLGRTCRNNSGRTCQPSGACQ